MRCRPGVVVTYETAHRLCCQTMLLTSTAVPTSCLSEGYVQRCHKYGAGDCSGFADARSTRARQIDRQPADHNRRLEPPTPTLSEHPDASGPAVQKIAKTCARMGI